jgi:hypothetical protein
MLFDHQIFSRNIPQLVRNALWTLFPDSLSATIDCSSLSSVFNKPKNRINQSAKVDITNQSHPACGIHQRDQVVALGIRREHLVHERPTQTHGTTQPSDPRAT